MYSYSSIEISIRIKKTLKEKNIRQVDFFSDLCISKSTLSGFRTSMPKADTLAKIADYLDISVDYLLGRSPDKGSYFEFWEKFNRLSERDKIKLELRAEDMLQESTEH